MPRFVILRHECPPNSQRPSHWDLMLEDAGVLRTWALAEEPLADRSVAAQGLADHRIFYLDYQGPLSGDRGSVSLWDRGTYQTKRESADELVVRLHGDRLQCHLRLVRDPEDDQRWSAGFESEPMTGG